MQENRTYSKHRERILTFYRIMYEMTDEFNALTMDEILDELSSRGINAECRAIYDDIRALNETFAENPDVPYAFSVSILKTNIRPIKYYLKSRELTPKELKLLYNLVKASPYASKRDSKRLLKKLEHLGNEQIVDELRKQNYVVYQKDEYSEAANLKTGFDIRNDHFIGGSVFDKMEAIQKAITNNRCISLKYYGHILSTKSDSDGNAILRNKGYRHDWISPFEIVAIDGEFHLVAVSYSNNPQKRRIVSYNLRKVSEIEIRKFDRQGHDLFKAFSDEKRGSSGRFILDSQSESVRASLVCSTEILDNIIDRFGETVKIIKLDSEHFKISPYVQINYDFIGWVLSFGDKIKVTAPDELITRIKIQLENTRKLYSGRGKR